MRIGLLTTSFPRFEGDGAGDFVLGFARALERRGHTLTVLAPEPAEDAGAPRFDGIDLVWLPYLRPRSLQRTFYGSGVPDNLRRDARAALGLAPFTVQLLREARRRAPGWDAVVSHWAVPSALVAGLLPGRPRHLAVLHSADVFALESLPGGTRLARQVARTSDQLLFVSRDLRRRFLQLLGERGRLACEARAHVSPMGVEPAPRAPGVQARARLRERLALPEGPVVLSMARLVPIKGLERLVDAARAHPHLQVVLAGEGDERVALERRARGLSNVRFVGHVQGETKRHWLLAADVFALPSRQLRSGRSEGTPAALLEAMAAGLPVLATAIGGVPDVLRDGQEGSLVPDDDDAWLGALGSLPPSAELRARGRRARQRARAFHWTALAPRLEALLSAGPQAGRARRP